MLYQNMISQYGARNVCCDGEVIGFQFEFELPDAPNTSIALFEKVQVFMDGEVYEGASIQISVDQHNYFGLDELLDFREIRWDYGGRAVIRVLKMGGAAPGCHELQCIITHRGGQPGYDTSGSRKLTFV